MTDSAPIDTPPAPAAESAPTGSPELQALLADMNGLSVRADEAFANAASVEALEEVRLEFLGKKGVLAELNRRFGTVSVEEKPAAGKALNTHKEAITARLEVRRAELEAAALKARLSTESVDITLPGTMPARGRLHPVTQVRREIEGIFRAMGFQVTESPEIETDWFNFEALNFPPDHPARDMQDTFFTDRGRVLRTHTSPNQIRTMSTMTPPFAVVSAGKVYRCDSDITHSPMFHQMEGFVVGKNVSMGHLKGTLQQFVNALYGVNTPTRFRPSFFPFTEPSAEVDIQCVFCKGKGCRVCSNSGWLEVLGCGMIHPNVLTNCGIDPEAWTGFAFGLGLDRLAMLRYGINNIRLLYENDVRFLSQF